MLKTHQPTLGCLLASSEENEHFSVSPSRPRSWAIWESLLGAVHDQTSLAFSWLIAGGPMARTPYLWSHHDQEMRTVVADPAGFVNPLVVCLIKSGQGASSPASMLLTTTATKAGVGISEVGKRLKSELQTTGFVKSSSYPPAEASGSLSRDPVRPSKMQISPPNTCSSTKGALASLTSISSWRILWNSPG